MRVIHGLYTHFACVFSAAIQASGTVVDRSRGLKKLKVAKKRALKYDVSKQQQQQQQSLLCSRYKRKSKVI